MANANRSRKEQSLKASTSSDQNESNGAMTMNVHVGMQGAISARKWGLYHREIRNGNSSKLRDIAVREKGWNHRMRKATIARMFVAAAVSAVLALPANAEEHRVTRLGNPSSSFHRPPLTKPVDFRNMLHNKMADVEAALQRAGWPGSVADLDRAAQDPAAKIGEVTIQPGTSLPYMALRRRGKPDVITNVVWAGKNAFDAYTIEFDSAGHRYRLTAPKKCGNFWIEEMQGGPTMIQPEGVGVGIKVAGELCVTQPVDVTVNVRDTVADAQVVLTAEGQEPVTGTASGGVFQAKLGAYNTPGQHEITATVGDAHAAATVTVNPCPPSCSLSVTPATIRRGKPFTVDASGSHVAPNVTVGIKMVSVEILLEGTVVEQFDLTPPSLRRDDVVVKKAGNYTIRAVATDEVGQSSSNVCEASLEGTGSPFPLFAAVFFGKERLEREGYAGGHCAPLLGAKVGVLPRVGENVELEASFGGKLEIDDTENSSVFVDLAVNGLLSKGFVGGGVSFWDLTHKDTRTAALLVQGGVDLTQDGRFQFVVEGRIPFDKFDNIANNYQFWGGVRFRAARR